MPLLCEETVVVWYIPSISHQVFQSVMLLVRIKLWLQILLWFHTWYGPVHRDSSGYWASLEHSYQLLTLEEGEFIAEGFFT